MRIGKRSPVNTSQLRNLSNVVIGVILDIIFAWFSAQTYATSVNYVQIQIGALIMLEWNQGRRHGAAIAL